MTEPLPALNLETGDRLHGFQVTAVTPLENMRLVACELVHEKSGARLLHLLTHDPENLFAVAFRTPPPDDTGLPHILEHTVLCGSRKYPVKDPFVELLKTSLATFLNAMTYPDKTVYPCASMNENDFFNLADVYADAVFQPHDHSGTFQTGGPSFRFCRSRRHIESAHHQGDRVQRNEGGLLRSGRHHRPQNQAEHQPGQRLRAGLRR